MSKVYTYDIFIKNLIDSNGYTMGGYTAQVIPYLENTLTGEKQPATDENGVFYPTWYPEYDYASTYSVSDIEKDIKFIFEKIGPYTEDGRKYPLEGTTEDGVPPPITPNPPKPPPIEEKNTTSKEQKEKTKKEEDIPFYIIGKLIENDTFNPIPEAKIKSSIGNFKTVSEIDGTFALEGKYKPSKKFQIIIKAKGYGREEKSPFKLDNSINPNIGIILLTSNKKNLDMAIREELQIPDIEILKMKIQVIKDNPEIAKQMAINALVTTLKTVVLPMVLKMILEFGISKASEVIGKKFGEIGATCPPNLEELNKLIKRKNDLTKQLNNIYNKLDTIKVGVQGVDTFISIADIFINTITPLYQLAPIAGAGLPDFSKPLTPIIDKTKDKITQLKLVSSGTLMAITLLINILQKIINYLSLLDSLVQGCAIEGQLSQEELTKDLLEATQQQSQQQSPVVTNVNGFEMDVISVNNSQVNNLKRRQAIAKNEAGVIMLKGEPSFSSNDQILIDELVFYIKQNNLKAD
jgi:hypothetical protein